MKINLSALFLARCQAYESLPTLALNVLTPEQRTFADQQSEAFRKADAAIVAELKRLKKTPVVKVKGEAVEFRLTGDGLGFCLASPGAPFNHTLVWSSRHGFQPTSDWKSWRGGA